MSTIIKTIGMIAAIALPFWNIPLIYKIVQRKSSNDISLAWVCGVWVCILLMLPSTIISSDPILRTFGVINTLFFTVVFFTVLKYRTPH